jgi:hypothetical protein
MGAGCYGSIAGVATPVTTGVVSRQAIPGGAEVFRDLRDRIRQRSAGRKATKIERLRKRAAVDARRREHKLRHGGSGGGGDGGMGAGGGGF